MSADIDLDKIEEAARRSPEMSFPRGTEWKGWAKEFEICDLVKIDYDDVDHAETERVARWLCRARKTILALCAEVRRLRSVEATFAPKRVELPAPLASGAFVGDEILPEAKP